MRNERLGTKRGIRGGPAAQSITFSFEENGSHQHNYESVPLSQLGIREKSDVLGHPLEDSHPKGLSGYPLQ